MRYVKMCFLALMLLLTATCGGPADDVIRKDFNQVVYKELGREFTVEITSISAGEGDSANVYEHVRFNLTANAGGRFNPAWLGGIAIRSGQTVFDGEVSMLYQRLNTGDWKMMKYQLLRAPTINK
jgi:hypothetical protein